MTRSTILAAVAACAVLASCGTPARDKTADNAAALNAESPVEDVPSDSLAAPEGLPLDRESNSAGNAE